MKSLTHLFHLFYPNTCLACETYLLDQEKILCLSCRFDLPLVDNRNYKKNLITQIFEGKVFIENGASFLYYDATGKTKKLIHSLKYQGNQEVGSFIGNWFGKILLDSLKFESIDYIIPVPLHKKKRKKRGYNQLTTFGKSLSIFLHSHYLENVLLRISATKTQTFKKRIERFSNIESKFVIKNQEILENTHILLIDDVVTTGATLESCCKVLLKIKNVKISIVTMAITR